MLLALWLVLRLLSPAGFMPAFEHGSVTIVAWADGAPASPTMKMVGHPHHVPKTPHESCPYASAASLGGLVVDHPLLPVLLEVGIALLLGRAYLFLEWQRTHDRPPLRGPPLPS